MRKYYTVVYYPERKIGPIFSLVLPDHPFLQWLLDEVLRGDQEGFAHLVREVLEGKKAEGLYQADNLMEIKIESQESTVRNLRLDTPESQTVHTKDLYDLLMDAAIVFAEFWGCKERGNPWHGIPTILEDSTMQSEDVSMYYDPASGEIGFLRDLPQGLR